MSHLKPLRSLFKLAARKWRFRKSPALSTIYACERARYMPTVDVMYYGDVDVDAFVDVVSIKIRVRSYDVWFEVKEVSGKTMLFTKQLSPEAAMDAHRALVLTGWTYVYKSPSCAEAQSRYAAWYKVAKRVVSEQGLTLK